MAKRTRTDNDEQRDQIIEELGGEDAETTAEREALLEELEEGETPPTQTATTPAKLCECGCGQRVTRSFRPGHDQLLKGVLLRAFGGGDESAAAELLRRGWRTQAELDARKAANEERAEARAAREQGRVAKAEAKAAAKVAKLAEREAA